MDFSSETESLKSWFDRRVTRIIGSGVLVAFFYEQFHHNGLWALVIGFVVVAYYLVLIWDSGVLRGLYTNLVSAACICGLALYVHIAMGADTGLFIVPMVAVLAALPPSKTLQSITLSVACSVVTIIVSYQSVFPWGTLFGLAGVYAFVRGRNIRREAQQLREQHLVELNTAHEELQNAHRELERSSVESVRYAALSERSRIAREVHDVVGHNLTTLVVQLQALQYMLPGDAEAAAEAVPIMLDVARSGLNEVRKAVGELAEDESGLGVAALHGLVSQVETQSGLRIHFLADGQGSNWPVAISVVLYRIVQECLTNVLRYAHAENVWVHVTEQDGRVTLVVSDDGSYMDDHPLQPGFGFRGMIERAASVDGSCAWGSRSPHGLTVTVNVPLPIMGTEVNPSASEE